MIMRLILFSHLYTLKNLYLAIFQLLVLYFLNLLVHLVIFYELLVLSQRTPLQVVTVSDLNIFWISAEDLLPLSQIAYSQDYTR
jgi:hypothetical protein